MAFIQVSSPKGPLLTGDVVFSYFIYTEGLDRISFAKLLVLDQRGDLLNDVLVSSRSGWSVRFGRSEQEATPSISLSLAGVRCRYETEGKASIVLLFAGPEALEAAREAKSRTFQQKPVSGIVEEIAQEYDWETEIEPTKGSVPFINQLWESDWQFMLNVLAPRALSQQGGYGGYRLWLENGRTLHFHPPRYAEDPVAVYSVSGQPSETSLFYRAYVTVDYLEKDIFGGTALEVVGWDNVGAREVRAKVSELDAPARDLLGKGIPSPGRTIRRLTVPYRDDLSVEAATANLFTRANERSTSAEVVVYGNPALRPGRIVRLDHPERDGRPFPLSGKFLLSSVAHEISGARYQCGLRFIRPGGALIGEEIPVGTKR